MKKYLVIGLIVILGIGLFVIGYFLRKSGGEPTPIEGGSQNLPSASTSTPTVLPGANSRLKSESLGFSVRGFFAASDGGVVIVQPSGHITSIKDGKNTLLSETNISEIIRADFSADGKKVLVGFGGWNKPQFSVYDLGKRSWQPLVEGVTAATWNPSDLRIAYALKKSGYTSLSVIDFSASKPVGKEVTRIHAEDLNLTWIGKDEVAFWNKGNSQIPASAWKINLNTKKLTPLFTEKTSFDFATDRKGENILAAYDQAGALVLSLFGKQGGVGRILTAKTLPSKCGFEIREETATPTSTQSKSKTIERTYLYCAVPRNFEAATGKILVEDYAKRQVFSLDNFFKLDLPNGSFTPVYQGEESLDADQVKVAGEKIYFINRYDEKLYSISLK